MTSRRRRISQERARRIALAAQGFADPKPTGAVSSRLFRRAMNRMNILQLDSVNVVCRSHYLPMFARLGPYDRAKLDRYLYHSGELYESVAHEASFTWQDVQPNLRFRSRHARWSRAQELESEVPEYFQSVLGEIVERGPLSIKDLSDPGQRTGPWWGRSKGKIALEWLYASGRLAVSERTNMFVTVYDLPENVLRPEVLAQPDPSDDDEAMNRLVEIGARSHGIAADFDIADYYRLKVTDTRRILKQLVAEQTLEEVDVEGWKTPGYLHAEASQPRSMKARALLSPFDPVVWYRDRAERLFDFHYRIEIYVPEPKRVYGYYVLPFLLDDSLVGRVCLKADRKAGVLLVRGSFGEDDVMANRTDRDRVATELAASLAELAQWLDLDGVSVGERGGLARPLASAVKALT